MMLMLNLQFLSPAQDAHCYHQNYMKLMMMMMCLPPQLQSHVGEYTMTATNHDGHKPRPQQ